MTQVPILAVVFLAGIYSIFKIPSLVGDIFSGAANAGSGVQQAVSGAVAAAISNRINKEEDNHGSYFRKARFHSATEYSRAIGRGVSGRQASLRRTVGRCRSRPIRISN